MQRIKQMHFEREREKMCKNNGSTSVASNSMEKIHIQFAMKRDYEIEYYCKCLTPLLCIHWPGTEVSE